MTASGSFSLGLTSLLSTHPQCALGETLIHSY